MLITDTTIVSATASFEYGSLNGYLAILSSANEQWRIAVFVVGSSIFFLFGVTNNYVLATRPM